MEVVKQLPVFLMTATFPQLPGFQESRAALVRSERAVTALLLGGGLLLGGTLAVPLPFVNCGVLHLFVARNRGTLNLALAAAMWSSTSG